MLIAEEFDSDDDDDNNGVDDGNAASIAYESELNDSFFQKIENGSGWDFDDDQYHVNDDRTKIYGLQRQLDLCIKMAKLERERSCGLRDMVGVVERRRQESEQRVRLMETEMEKAMKWSRGMEEVALRKELAKMGKELNEHVIKVGSLTASLQEAHRDIGYLQHKVDTITKRESLLRHQCEQQLNTIVSLQQVNDGYIKMASPPMTPVRKSITVVKPDPMQAKRIHELEMTLSDVRKEKMKLEIENVTVHDQLNEMKSEIDGLKQEVALLQQLLKTRK